MHVYRNWALNIRHHLFHLAEPVWRASAGSRRPREGSHAKGEGRRRHSLSQKCLTGHGNDAINTILLYKLTIWFAGDISWVVECCKTGHKHNTTLVHLFFPVVPYVCVMEVLFVWEDHIFSQLYFIVIYLHDVWGMTLPSSIQSLLHSERWLSGRLERSESLLSALQAIPEAPTVKR